MSGPYDVLMVDPPWPIGDICDPSGSGVRRGLPYRDASLTEIVALLDRDVLPRASADAAVFLWVVDRFLVPAEQAMEARGYRRHARLIWDKGESGLAGAATLRRCHEYLVWYYRPPLRVIAKDAQGRYTTIIRAPRREHSRKPEAAYRLVEALYPAARRLDAFTREYRPGWDGWGDQRDHFTPLLAPLRDEALS